MSEGEESRKSLKLAAEPLGTLAIAEACDRLAATIRYDDEKDISEGDELEIVDAESGKPDGSATVEHTENVPVRRALDVLINFFRIANIQDEGSVLTTFYHRRSSVGDR